MWSKTRGTARKSTGILKDLVDKFDNLWLLERVESLSKLWYINKHNLNFINWDLCIKTGLFQERNYVSLNSSTNIVFPGIEEIGLDEAIVGFSKLGEDLLSSWWNQFNLIGFLSSSIRANEIRGIMRSFPMMYFSGLRWSGKTECLKLLSYVLGYKIWNESHLYNPNTGSEFALISFLWEKSYFSFIDEYKSTWEKRIDEHLKANYNCSNSSRGKVTSKNTLTTDQYPNDSVLIDAGEELTNNEALFERTVNVELLQGWLLLPVEDDYDAFVKHYRNLFFNILVKKLEKVEEIRPTIQKTRKILKDYGVRLEHRTFNNLVVVLVGNLLMWLKDDTYIAEGIESFVSTYGELKESAGVAASIVKDITTNPDRYLSLKSNFKEGKKCAIFPTEQWLVLIPEEIVKRYVVSNKSYNVPGKKVAKELVNYLWIISKLGDYQGNYYDANNTRTQNAIIPIDQVLENEKLLNLRDISKKKIVWEIKHLEKERLYQRPVSEYKEKFLQLPSLKNKSA